MNDLSGALRYLYGLETHGTVFGLANIEWILGLMGNPETQLRTVHIAGTNGKGSVASMLSRMLEEAGYRVGKYTSPHLVSFTERISINGVEIREEEVAALTEEIRERCASADKDRLFTFFDFTTALALTWFCRSHTDISVIETGLGGRLDSTNVIRPMVSIITNVDFDHTDYLGTDITSIAGEKAGIIKEGIPVVTGAQGEALRVIDGRAGQLGSPVHALGREFSFQKTGEGEMSYRGPGKSLERVRVNLRGDFQLANGALALSAAGELGRAGFAVSDEAMRRGLSRVEWPGRLEVVREKPTVLLDAAHNPQGIRAFAEYVNAHPGKGKKILVFGVMKDKEYATMLGDLAPLFGEVVLTRPAIERALAPELLKSLVPGARVTESVEEALRIARQMAGEEDLIAVTGSIYTIGEAKTILDRIF